MHGKLAQLDERGGAGVWYYLASCGCDFVHVCGDHGGRFDEFIDRVRGRRRGHRVRAEIEHGEVRFVEFINDRFHLGVDTGIPRQVNRKPVRKLDDKADRGTGSGFDSCESCGCWM